VKNNIQTLERVTIKETRCLNLVVKYMDMQAIEAPGISQILKIGW